MDANVPPQASPPGRPRRRPVLWLLLGALLAVVGVGAGRALTPPDLLLAGPRTVEVPPQSGLRDIARTLADAGVIRSEIAFVALAFARGTARSLKAGEYEVPQAASLLTTLELLEAGKVKPHLLV